MDGTKTLAQSFVESQNNFDYFLESNQGLSHARNRGWRESKGTYVAYIDDDCKLPENFLSNGIKIIDEVDPDVFGGPYFAFYNNQKPDWYKDAYGSHKAYNEARYIDETPEVLHGGNFFIRRALLESSDGFDTNLGMKGNKLAYGEETDLIRRIIQKFPKSKFYYDPALYLYHLVRSEKMQWLSIINSNFSTGKYNYYVFGAGLSRIVRIAKSCALFILVLLALPKTLIGLIFRSRKKYPFYQQYIYESSMIYIKYLGWIYEHITGSEYKQKLD